VVKLRWRRSPGCHGSPGTQGTTERTLVAWQGLEDLVSYALLVPVMALAQRAGLADLVAGHVQPAGEYGVNARLKVGCLVTGTAAGADSIDDMDLLRHSAMTSALGGVRAPSTLGSHLRSHTWVGGPGVPGHAGRAGAAAARRGHPGIH
jgi:hypothetical protein